MKRFKYFYGVIPKLVSILWKELLNNGWFDFPPTKNGTSTFTYGTSFLDVLHHWENKYKFFIVMKMLSDNGVGILWKVLLVWIKKL